MWGNDKKHKPEKVDTLIGSHTELHGDVVFTGGLHVDGKIKGNVISSKQGSTMLVISEKGSVEGEIRVPYMIVNGLVVGDIYASESVELARNARITGNVYYNRIEVAMGAEVNGSLVHKEERAEVDASAPVVLETKRKANS